MKKNHFFMSKRKLVYSLLLLITFFSCKKLLNPVPDSSFDTEYVFSSPITATSSVLGVYNTLAGDNGYGSRISLYYSMDDDNIIGPPNKSSGGGDNDRTAIARYNATSGNAQLESPFNRLYAGIERANICIKNIPLMNQYANGSAGDKITLQRLYGEALALRAQFYFEAVRNWGDLPAPFIPSADQTNLFLTKTDRDSIYNNILTDLKTAENLVPWRTEVTRDERLTKGAIKGLRARVALFRGGYSLRRSSHVMERKADYLSYYQIARDECNDVMQRRDQHDLNPGYKTVFKDALDAHILDPKGEVMFEVALAGGNSSTDGKFGYYDGNKVNSKGNRSLTLIPTYFYAFDSLDTRRDVTGAPYDVDANGYKVGNNLYTIASAKFRRDWISNPVVDPTSAAQYYGVNWPILRFSDVLLMFAEADNELTSAPSAAAISAYEEVRKRAFAGNINKIGTTPTTKAAFFDAIVNERSLEFGGEGIRKFDLIRWNLINQKIADTRANLTKMLNKQAPYQNLPQTVYYKISSTGDLTYYSSLYLPAPTVAPPTSTWKSVSWVSSVTASYITNVAELFKPNHSELLPLPLAIITSNPNIAQDCGCDN